MKEDEIDIEGAWLKFQKIVRNKILMTTIMILACIAFGFLVGGLYVCTNSGGEFFENFDCVDMKTTDYCVFEEHVYINAPEMKTIERNFSP